MPEPAAVRASWAEFDNVDATAARLDVSPSAMEWQLFNLGRAEEIPAL